MNNMNSQMNHYHQENPYHTFENVYTANHEHVVAPNMHDPMNMPNHYHSGKKDVYHAHHPHHYSAYSTFPNQHDFFSQHVPMKDHHHQGHYGAYGMTPYHPYSHQDMHMMMQPNQQMAGHFYGMNQPNALFPRHY